MAISINAAGNTLALILYGSELIECVYMFLANYGLLHLQSFNPDKARLFHVQSKQYATAEEEYKFLELSDGPSDKGTFLIIELESLVILPRYVAFKASNDLYLQLADPESNQLKFISNDKGIPESWLEVSTGGDGRVKVKCGGEAYTNSYLRCGGDAYSNWIFGDGGDDKPPTDFLPVKIDNSTVALKTLSNDRFCAMYTFENIKDGLNAAYKSIATTSRFRLEELVFSRRIYNTNFDLKNAIIYGETPVTMATANASNSTSADNTVEFKFEYKDSKSSTWKTSHSWMVGVKVSVSFKMPFIGGTDVNASSQFSGTYEWGETVTSENTLETTYTVTVPAYTSVSVSLMATKGTCDVPYSYYQRDVLYNGKAVYYHKDDGLYTGVNSYNFRYEVTTEDQLKKLTLLQVEDAATSAATKP